MTGYWFGNHDPAWRPSHALVEFLASGPAPVCIGFGSMSSYNARHAAECVGTAMRLTNSRGILLTGWGGSCQVPVSDDVFQIDSAPHEWLFPKTAAAAANR